MTDTELFLLGWAVVATFKALEYRTREHMARGAFMHLVRDPKARKKILDDWEEFKREHGAT